MILRKWEELPEFMQIPEVREYYDILNKRRADLVIKRLFDIVVAFIILVVIFLFMLGVSIAIVIDSKGPVFFRQIRITRYGEKFRIFKFRSMVQDAEKKGTSLTIGEDSRITKVGKFVRKIRADEFCQVLDILRGKMTFVGTRPEVPKYVDKYTPEMLATLLLPAGATSECSIFFKDEDKLISKAKEEAESKKEVFDEDKYYVEEILPMKMKYNLRSLKKFTFGYECRVMWYSVWSVLGKEYKEEDFEIK